MAWFLEHEGAADYDCDGCPAEVRRDRSCPTPSAVEIKTIALRSATDGHIPLRTCPRRHAEMAQWTGHVLALASHLRAHNAYPDPGGVDDQPACLLGQMLAVLRVWTTLDEQDRRPKQDKDDSGSGRNVVRSNEPLRYRVIP